MRVSLSFEGPSSKPSPGVTAVHLVSLPVLPHIQCSHKPLRKGECPPLQLGKLRHRKAK